MGLVTLYKKCAGYYAFWAFSYNDGYERHAEAGYQHGFLVGSHIQYTCE